MRFWWVNLNQTFEHEFRGGYLWSPKRNKNGARNPFYETMREVAPAIVFSFRDRAIAAVGVAQSYGYECPKPDEFGKVGTNWNLVGWRVDVKDFVPERPGDPEGAHRPASAPVPGEILAAPRERRREAERVPRGGSGELRERTRLSPRPSRPATRRGRGTARAAGRSADGSRDR